KVPTRWRRRCCPGASTRHQRGLGGSVPPRLPDRGSPPHTLLGRETHPASPPRKKPNQYAQTPASHGSEFEFMKVPSKLDVAGSSPVSRSTPRFPVEQQRPLASLLEGLWRRGVAED